MTRRQTYINKIRELGYEYKTTQKRTYSYRKHGTTDYIFVPMADLLTDEFVAHSLRQAGLSADEVRFFLAGAKS